MQVNQIIQHQKQVSSECQNQLLWSLQKRNITVNCISPGFIETEMTAVLSDEQKEIIRSKIPQDRIGKPKDVAYCV